MTTDVIYDQPMVDYLSTAAVSKSILTKLIQECPRAAWASSWLNPDRRSESNTAMDIGTLVHSLFLERNTGRVVCVDPEQYPADNGNVPNGWTNKAIRQARQDIVDRGDIPVLRDDYDNAARVRDALESYVDTLKDGPAHEVWRAFQPACGNAEVTLLWDEQGVRCRARPDMLSEDRKLIVDLKTTAMSANPAAWGRTQLTGQHGYMSAVLYAMATRAIFDVETQYVFLVVETKPPYLCSLIGVCQEALQLGAEKITAALDLWRRCVDTGQWPGYPPTIAYPELPVYMAYAWEEQQAGYEYTYERMFTREKQS